MNDMKKLLLLSLPLLMVGCETSERIDTQLCEENYHTIVIDSCEYLSCKRLYDLTHKGNCKFCADRRRQEIKELVYELKK